MNSGVVTIYVHCSSHLLATIQHQCCHVASYVYIFFREVLQQLLPAASPFMQYEYGSACGFASIRNKWYPRRPIKPLAK